MQKYLWGGAALIVAGAATCYVGVDHAARYPDSFLGRLGMTVGAVSLHCNPVTTMQAAVAGSTASAVPAEPVVAESRPAKPQPMIEETCEPIQVEPVQPRSDREPEPQFGWKPVDAASDSEPLIDFRKIEVAVEEPVVPLPYAGEEASETADEGSACSDEYAGFKKILICYLKKMLGMQAEIGEACESTDASVSECNGLKPNKVFWIKKMLRREQMKLEQQQELENELSLYRDKYQQLKKEGKFAEAHAIAQRGLDLIFDYPEFTAMWSILNMQMDDAKVDNTAAELRLPYRLVDIRVFIDGMNFRVSVGDDSEVIDEMPIVEEGCGSCDVDLFENTDCEEISEMPVLEDDGASTDDEMPPMTESYQGAYHQHGCPYMGGCPYCPPSYYPTQSAVQIPDVVDETAQESTEESSDVEYDTPSLRRMRSFVKVQKVSAWDKFLKHYGARSSNPFIDTMEFRPSDCPGTWDKPLFTPY